MVEEQEKINDYIYIALVVTVLVSCFVSQYPNPEI
jgi:hypothetical protein